MAIFNSYVKLPEGKHYKPAKECRIGRSSVAEVLFTMSSALPMVAWRIRGGKWSASGEVVGDFSGETLGEIPKLAVSSGNRLKITHGCSMNVQKTSFM